MKKKIAVNCGCSCFIALPPQYLPCRKSVSMRVSLTVYFDVEYCDKVDAKMSAEDAETVKKMFEGKSAYFDSPSCGFSENASIRIGCNTYMPACDGDETVKHGFMYFSLSKSENNELRKIMKKYGADTRKAI